MTEKFYLVDGSGYIFRAYYAVAPLNNSQGFPTNALFGYTRMLLKLIGQRDSGHLIVVFDAGRETFRTELYSEYKANRVACPEDLLQQMPYFREISKALGLPVLELRGYEADDIIATLATRFSALGAETVIISGDKDLTQLIRPGVTMWDSMRDLRYGAKEVKEKFGVPPEKVVELLGLSGDTSDNVPGLKGVGPKTAVQLIEKFGDVEGVIAAVQQIREDSSIRNRSKIAEQIELNPELLRLSRKLVEVKTDVPLQLSHCGKEISLEQTSSADLAQVFVRTEPNREELQALFNKLEFLSLLKEFDLALSAAPQPEQSGFKYNIIYADGFEKWAADFSAQSEYAFDLETTSLDPLQAQIVGASFSWGTDQSFYIPLGHKSAPAGKQQISTRDFLDRCRGSLESSSTRKIGQNLKYDISILKRHGLRPGGIYFDTMLASYLLNPDKGSHNLTALAGDYLGRGVIEFEDVVGEKTDFSEVEIDAAARYAGDDARNAWELRLKMEPLLQEKKLFEIFSSIEVPLVPVLSEMELLGIKLDTSYLAALSEELGQRLDALKGELFGLAGCQFNINSPKQLSEVLFTKLALSTKGLKKTKSGISTDSSVLEKLAPLHPLPAKILDYRSLYKLKSTYVDALPAQLSKITGRLHTRFNQTVTGTGRLSSSDPNLQNIPIQTAEGRRVRKAFIADQGSVLISADYSQIELRLLAHMSEDANLIAAFHDQSDIHRRTARELFGIANDAEVSSEQRRIGKTINFGIIYGMGPQRLARELGISFAVANQYIEDYFARYPKVRTLFAKIEKDAQELGYVTTVMGRKRFVSSIDASGRDQGFVLRAALNAPFQGSAADIVKLAMIALDQRIVGSKAPLKMLLQIHDELVFECPQTYAAEAVKMIQAEMEGVLELRVPLKVDVGVGANWEEAHQ
ncbi:MAG: DNA polymerase I [Oligoflexia bacterium]|nr:DNA polymerase I [Oligoflexia bacterium]